MTWREAILRQEARKATTFSCDQVQEIYQILTIKPHFTYGWLGKFLFLKILPNYNMKYITLIY